MSAHADHHEFQAHHFDDMEQQFDAGKLGMWLFLATEVLFFSGMFVAYTVYRYHHPEVFVAAHHFLDKWLGGFNTVVLLASSLSVAWGVRCAQLDNRKGLIGCLIFTLACAGLFMGVKAVEYTLKFEEGVLWASAYSPPAPGAHPDLTDAYSLLTNMAIVSAVIGAILIGLGYWSGLGRQYRGWVLVGLGATVLSVALGIVSARGIQEAEVRLGLVHDTHGDGEHGDGEHHDGDAGHADDHDDDGHNDPAHDDDGGHDEPSTDQQIPLTNVADEESAQPSDQDDQADEGDPVMPGVAPVDGGQIDLVEPNTSKQHLEGVFFSIYFAMTGVHALHIVGGILVIVWITGRAGLGQFDHSYFGPVEYVGLYWHLVDLIWIFLFPLLYLIR